MAANNMDPGNDIALPPRDEAFSDFARRPPWYEDIHPELDPRKIAEDIAIRLKCLKEFNVSEIEEKEELMRGFTQRHITQYVKDDRGMHDFAETDAMSEEVSSLPKEVQLKWRNMMNALEYLFPSALFPQLDINDIFTLKSVQHIHKMLADQLIPNGGDFRTNDAAPFDRSVYYMDPELIVKELDHLLAKVREESARIDTSKEVDAIQVVKMVNLASYFLSRFLFIHPFSNGNGRVARLLMSAILSRISAVPVQLYFRGRRESYLQALRDAQRLLHPTLEILRTGILESVWITLTNACFALDL